MATKRKYTDLRKWPDWKRNEYATKLRDIAKEIRYRFEYEAMFLDELAMEIITKV